TLISEPLDDSNWIFEPKFDGQRVLGRFDGHKVQLLSRYGHDDTLWFPEIPRALKESLSSSALVDGEIVSLDKKGKSEFRMLQQRFHLRDPRRSLVAQKSSLRTFTSSTFSILPGRTLGRCR